MIGLFEREPIAATGSGMSPASPPSTITAGVRCTHAYSTCVVIRPTSQYFPSLKFLQIDRAIF